MRFCKEKSSTIEISPLSGKKFETKISQNLLEFDETYALRI